MVGLLSEDFLADRVCLSHLSVLTEQLGMLELRFQDGDFRLLRTTWLEQPQKIGKHLAILTNARAPVRNWHELLKLGNPNSSLREVRSPLACIVNDRITRWA
jgi:hypothetical protein